MSDWITIPWSAIAVVCEAFHLSHEDFQKLSFDEFMKLYHKLSPLSRYGLYDTSVKPDREKIAAIVESTHPRPQLEV